MRSIRIYEPGNYSSGQTLELSEGASRHVALVLRMQPGEALTLFCGDNQEFYATISMILKKKVIVTIQSQELVDRESACTIRLGQAIAKGDRMDWVIQKAVELGVSSITPVITSRCAVRLDADKLMKKQFQWQAIAISACEQCGRNKIPTIHQPLSLAHFVKQCQAAYRLVLDPYAKITWHDFDAAARDVALLIGPEGGLSEEEIQQARSNHFHSWRLGPRVLRTETAAIAGITLLQSVIGDL